MMKSLKMFACICVLTLCVASTTIAGDIPAPGIVAPPPPPATQQAQTQDTGTTTSYGTNVSEPTLWDTLISSALSLLSMAR